MGDRAGLAGDLPEHSRIPQPRRRPGVPTPPAAAQAGPGALCRRPVRAGVRRLQSAPRRADLARRGQPSARPVGWPGGPLRDDLRGDLPRSRPPCPRPLARGGHECRPGRGRSGADGQGRQHRDQSPLRGDTARPPDRLRAGLAGDRGCRLASRARSRPGAPGDRAGDPGPPLRRPATGDAAGRFLGRLERLARRVGDRLATARDGPGAARPGDGSRPGADARAGRSALPRPASGRVPALERRDPGTAAHAPAPVAVPAMARLGLLPGPRLPGPGTSGAGRAAPTMAGGPRPDRPDDGGQPRRPRHRLVGCRGGQGPATHPLPAVPDGDPGPRHGAGRALRTGRGVVEARPVARPLSRHAAGRGPVGRLGSRGRHRL